MRGGRRWLRYCSPDSEQEVAVGVASPSYCPTRERTTVCSALITITCIPYCVFELTHVTLSDLFI